MMQNLFNLGMKRNTRGIFKGYTEAASAGVKNKFITTERCEACGILFMKSIHGDQILTARAREDTPRHSGTHIRPLMGMIGLDTVSLWAFFRFF